MTISFFRSIAHLAKRQRLPSWTPDFVRRSASEFVRRSHRRYHELSMEEAVGGKSSNLDDIASFLEENAVPIAAPCVLISQAQRSGGSLLSQLFDGHPAIAAYPNELRFGFVDQDLWPDIDPAKDAAGNFRSLFDLQLTRQMSRGYVKGGTQIFSKDKGEFVDRNIRSVRFFYVPLVHFAVFRQLFMRSGDRTGRSILDAFFAGFFNAWLDYQGRLEEKRWVTAFAPRFATIESNVSSFFASYPDGYLIQIVRDPRTWYPSAKNHRRAVLRGDGQDDLLALWRESARSIRTNRERYGDRLIVLTFEQLVGDTERTMRRIAATLGIAFDKVLLEPTFNGFPVKANSSFANEKGGVVAAPLSRAAALSDDERALIERECVPLYDALVKYATSGDADGAATRPSSVAL